jgi:hypothetical protein
MMNWKEHFKYDETSPSCLRWVRYAASGRIVPGAVAGNLKGKKDQSKKYYRVFCIDRSYSCARIIWEMFNGTIPEGYQIDHIDINPQNNTINNLCLKLNKSNSQNRKKLKRNKSGVNGVHLSVNQGRLYWVAQWNDTKGKRVGKTFAVTKYGDEEAFKLACLAREQAVKILNENGMNYTERHGK